MIKTLRQANIGEREKLKVPRSVQRSIPIRRIYRDNLWQVGGGRYSLTWKFADINYAVASRDDKVSMFLDYCALLNSLPTDSTIKVTINNRRQNPVDFENAVLMKEQGDGLDLYRREYNGILQNHAEAQANIVREKYVTVSTTRPRIGDARSYFARVDGGMSSHFARLGSKSEILTNHDRLRILHDFFRPGEETEFYFDMRQSIRRGSSFTDFICPDSIQFKADHFLMGDKVGRVLFLKDYASYIKDSMITELCDVNRNLMLSIDIIPVPTDEAVAEIEKKMMALETDAARWQRQQNMRNNFTAVLPYEMEQLRNEIKEFADDMANDKRMMFVVVTLVHIADNLKQLDTDTETLLSLGRKNLCQFATLRYRQEDGLNTALPYGMRKVDALRTLTTESAAVLTPFYAQEVMHDGGTYCGVNAISRNLIALNRKELMNGNAFFLAVSGGGKSFAAKCEIAARFLSTTNEEILICDPEREYGKLVEALNGTTFRITAGGPHHLNALDLSRDFEAGENPVVLKSEFVLSLCEQVIGAGNLGAIEKSIIDRCVANVYRGYMLSPDAPPPTLRNFHAELMNQPEREAKEIALSMELFINGSLDVFAHPTNVDMSNRLTCFDILDLGSQLKPVGMCVILDAIMNRVTKNRKRGIRTHVFIDEIYLFFNSDGNGASGAASYSANFLSQCWKRFRKYNATCTGITQNVSDLLQSHLARTMLANSEYLLMLNQAATDRAELAELLNISETQLSYITNAQPGHGLLKIGQSLIPFKNEWPKDTELYKLMNTKPGEG